MTTHTANRSSWIQSVAFKRVGNRTWLAVFIADEHAPTSPGYGTIPVAMLYGDVPSYLPGLLVAGTAARSVGHAYNALVKGKFPYQRIEGRERVQELRALMSAAS